MGTCRYHSGETKNLFSLYELSKSKITTDIQNQARKECNYVQVYPKIIMQQGTFTWCAIQETKLWLVYFKSYLKRNITIITTFLAEHYVFSRSALVMSVEYSHRGIINQPLTANSWFIILPRELPIGMAPRWSLKYIFFCQFENI